MSSDSDEPPIKKSKVDKPIPCPYGAKCYRKNPQHFREYSHPNKDVDDKDETASSSTSVNTSNLPPCKYGSNCYRKNLLHFAEYWHPCQSTQTGDNKDTEELSDTDIEPDDSGDDTDIDIQHLEEELDDKKSKLVKSKTDFLKRGPSLIKSFTKMTEEERKELIVKAFEAKQQLQDELKESKGKIEEQSKELERLQNHVASGTLLMEGEEETLKENAIRYYTLIAERSYKEGSAAQVHFRLAESQFYRLVSGHDNSYQVSKVEYVVNAELVKRFRKAREDLKKFRGEDMAYPVLGFHGTNEDNIGSICSGGFRIPGEAGFTHITDTGWYGKGVYFSEYPTYSMDYISGGTKLLLCQVLLGKVFQCTKLIHGKPLKSGYDSHTSPDRKELVIFNSHHILPCYIVHYKEAEDEFHYIDKKCTVSKEELATTRKKAFGAKKSKVFQAKGFNLYGKLSDTKRNIKEFILKHGGHVVTADVASYVIASEASGNSTNIVNARKCNAKLSVVREDYIYDCVLQKSLLDDGPYVIN